MKTTIKARGNLSRKPSPKIGRVEVLIGGLTTIMDSTDTFSGEENANILLPEQAGLGLWTKTANTFLGEKWNMELLLDVQPGVFCA